ncbi:MAG: VRR-NUC domain-containing protein [Pseudomonadaceae bacterium]|nr:MAG: VRR-NUC domain-containing protein [Pseudomonadaceae bacterium]
MKPSSVADPFYYLHNFRQVLDWVAERYADLLDHDEQAFIAGFARLPLSSQALLVRLIMRKGPHFRADKLAYPEIGDTASAAAPLLASSWLQTDARLDASSLFSLLRRSELLMLAGSDSHAKESRKSDLLPWLKQAFPDGCTWSQLGLVCKLYTLSIGSICDRLRLLFFGNLSQTWAEFVLVDQGIFRYPKIPIDQHSRGFHSRHAMDDYLAIHQCREALDNGIPATDILAQLPPLRSDSSWLAQRHARLRFRLARQLEREGAWQQAWDTYTHCDYPGSLVRRVRLLEQRADWSAAWALSHQPRCTSTDDAEQQLLQRAQHRLAGKLGKPRPPKPATEKPDTLTLTLPPAETCVELAVSTHLHNPNRPVHYVENSLFNGLFGLLCWDALYTPLPGAFFHPFQSVPADLYQADFVSRRQALFDQCLKRLQDDSYKACIEHNWRALHGLQSPFLDWGVLKQPLLRSALQCLPALHLRVIFQRMLSDLHNNRSGFPDLIQLDLEHNDYRLIEVKGPGDRLQDNQRRWMAFAAQHGIPVALCHVSWVTT